MAPTDEDGVRRFVTVNGGGVIVWWRGHPVQVRYAPLDPKSKTANVQIFAAAVAQQASEPDGARIYLLERAAHSRRAPTWRAFETGDVESICM